MIDIQIDTDSHRPPYEQLRVAVIEMIRDGRLLTGGKLPTVRALAAELDLAPNTVARAYRELETAGFIETRGRNGSFISADDTSALRRAQHLAVEYVTATRELGIDDDTALAMVNTALRNEPPA